MSDGEMFRSSPIANSITRSRLSLPQVTSEVDLNGSCFCVTESRAMARVEVSWLIKVSLADCARLCSKSADVDASAPIATETARKNVLRLRNPFLLIDVP